MVVFLTAMLAASAADVERREVGPLVLENVPETPADVAERMRQFQNVRSASLIDFAADGNGLLVSTRFGETAQLHHVAEPGGARTQLTFYDEPLRGVLPHPTDPDRMLLSRDVGGSEQFQVWHLDLSTGEAVQVSSGEGRATGASWSSDGTKVAWFSTLEGTNKALWVGDVTDDGIDAKKVGEVDGAWWITDWLPGNGEALGAKYISANDTEVYRIDMTNGNLAEVNPQKKPVAYNAIDMDPGGRNFYAATDFKADRMQLWRFPMDRGRPQLLVEADGFDVDTVVVSPDGSHVAYTTNDDGRSRLFLRKAEDWSEVPVPELPPGVLYGLEFDDDGDRIGITLNRADAPGDAYVFDLGSTELVRWTTSEVGGLDTERFVEPEFFRYESFDGLSVPAFVYRAPGDGPRPVVISIHGGPEGQSRPYFSSTYQFWATELGITVVVPNVRGSRGFGSEYLKMDNGLKRKDSVGDIGGLLDWIGTQDDMDPERVVVYGGSYGGYMVLASMIDFADRLAGGVDIVGISDFKTFLANTKDYRRDLRRAEYGDERDPKIAAFFDEISPLAHADQIADPLFVIQGANDPRVPASEAEQIVAAVRESGLEAWYMLAMDEGHGFRKKSNRDAMNEAVVLYFQKVMGLE